MIIFVHYITAQPCDRQLVAPQNGSIWCSGDQVTDQNCSFACDAGFTFTGSELRKCLSNNSWTGVDVVCIPKHCHPLTNPPNGYVDIVNDCETVLTTMCEIKCVEGYYINNTTPFYQTCVANKTSGDVYWTTAPDCECEQLLLFSSIYQFITNHLLFPLNPSNSSMSPKSL